jgi:RNA polymerase sigma-70 factor (ECF subfamily)
MTTTPGSRTLRDGQSSAPAAAPNADATDADIVAALSRGETQTALRVCVERHGASIGRFCMAMLGSQQDADAVTEETLLSAQQRFAELGGAASLRAWVFGLARDHCLQHLERRRRRRAKLAAETDGGALFGDADVELRATRARAWLEHVRPSDRDALLLRFAADLSFEEVAAACGVDGPTARRRASRALLRLRNLLESEHDDE